MKGGNIYAAWEDRIVRTIIRDAISATLAHAQREDTVIKSMTQFVTLFNTVNGALVSETTIRRWLRTLGISWRQQMVLSVDPDSPLNTPPPDTVKPPLTQEPAATVGQDAEAQVTRRPVGITPGHGGIVSQ